MPHHRRGPYARRVSGSAQKARRIREVLGTAVAFLVVFALGFGVGYGVREQVSRTRRRRDLARRWSGFSY
jgi:hypothetical protein